MPWCEAVPIAVVIVWVARALRSLGVVQESQPRIVGRVSVRLESPPGLDLEARGVLGRRVLPYRVVGVDVVPDDASRGINFEDATGRSVDDERVSVRKSLRTGDDGRELAVLLVRRIDTLDRRLEGSAGVFHVSAVLDGWRDLIDGRILTFFPVSVAEDEDAVGAGKANTDPLGVMLRIQASFALSVPVVGRVA